MKKIFLISFSIITMVIVILAITIALSMESIFAGFVINVVGADVKMDDAALDFKNNILRIKNLSIYNPKGFAKERLAYIPEIIVEYDPTNLFENRKLRITKLTFNMKTLAVIKDKDGRINVDELRIAKENIADVLPAQVDKLVFSVDDVVYTEFKDGGKPHIEMYDVNIKDRGLENLPSVDEVVRIVLAQTLENTAIKGAAVIGVAAVAGGPAALAVGAAILAAGRDSYEKDFEKSFDDAFNASLRVLEKLGKITYSSKETGLIKAEMEDSTVKVKIVGKTKGVSSVTVSARGTVRPKPRVAAAILYKIAEELEN